MNNWWKGLLLIGVALIIGGLSANVNAQSYTVTVSYPGLEQPQQTLTYAQPVRLAQVINDASGLLSKTQYHTINWSLARFGYQALNQQLTQRQQNVISRLNTLKDYWQQRQRYAFVQSIERLISDIQRWQLVSTTRFGLEPDRMRMVLAENGLLSASTSSRYHLVLPSSRWAPQALGLGKDDPAADQEAHWLLGADGQISAVPVALYNRNNASQCYAFDRFSPLENQAPKRCSVSEEALAHQFIGLSHNALTGRDKTLNMDIAELAKFIVGYRQ